MGRSCEFCFHPEGMEIMRNKVKRFTLSVVVAVSAACAPVAVVHADTKADLNIDRVISVEQERQTSTRSAFTEQANDAGKESERVSEEGIAFSLGGKQGEAQLSAGTALTEAVQSNKNGDNWVADSSTIYRDTDDGAAAYAIIPKEKSSTEWELQLPEDVNAKVNPSGEVEFQKPLQGGGNITYDAYLEKPWAVDREGEEVPTWYEIDNGKIVQKIERSDSNEEVLADPQISYGKGVYLNAWGHEFRPIHGMATVGVNGAFLAACNVSKLPTPVKLVLGPVCLVGGLNALDLVNAVKAVPEYEHNTCYQIRIAPNLGDRPHPVGAHECRN